MLTLIIYDITEDDVRSKVADFLRGKGLKRIQKSAFIGDLSSSQKTDIEAGLRQLVKGVRANVQIYPLTPASYNMRTVIGVELHYDDGGYVL